MYLPTRYNLIICFFICSLLSLFFKQKTEEYFIILFSIYFLVALRDSKHLKYLFLILSSFYLYTSFNSYLVRFEALQIFALFTSVLSYVFYTILEKNSATVKINISKYSAE